MISGYQPSRPLEPAAQGRMQWGAAIGAGFIAGAILLLAPRGSPWSGLSFFSPIIMGRTIPPSLTMPLIMVWLIHLSVSVIYGLIISRIVAGLRHQRAIFAGGLVGLLLYGVNFAMVSLFWSGWRGNEIPVVFTHIVFGLIAAGAYRGLLRREPASSRAEAGGQ